MSEKRMGPWVPDNNPLQARRIGKSIEEVMELGKVLARISIQGIDAINPSTGKTNRQELHEESADVLAQIECNVRDFGMDTQMLEDRKVRKIALMGEWESWFDNGGGVPQHATPPKATL